MLCSLCRLLATDQTTSSSQLLLTVKRWSEFFLRFRKSQPDLHRQLAELSLAVGRAARREGNTGLAQRFILRSLTGRAGSVSLQEFAASYDFYSGPAITPERARGLRQAAKLFLATGSRELGVRTCCGLVLGVGQVQAQQFTKQAELLQQSSRALLNLAGWVREDARLLEAVYPEVASSQSDLATLAQILSLESVTPGSRDSLQKAVPVSTSASEADLVQVLRCLLYCHLPTRIKTMKFGWHSLF